VAVQVLLVLMQLLLQQGQVVMVEHHLSLELV